MTQVYLRSGHKFTPADSEQLSMQPKLPAGTYTVGVTPAGYHLDLIDDFVLPTKMYGDTIQKANRIMGTFLARPSSTGVLLEGSKGSGKTVLSKLLSNIGRTEHNVITIVINQPIYGEGFNTFLQSISQPTIVIFDEFEKVYDRDEQKQLLTIFDGVYASKKLFILTCNDKYKVDSYMHNRPGRIYYSLSFKGLSIEFITEYCKDNLLNKENMKGVLVASGFFSEFSFDMVKALVEEMNRYGETATQAMSMLNIKPETDNSGVYRGKIMRDGKEVIYDTLHGSVIRNSPLVDGVTLYGEYDDNEASGKEDDVFPVESSKLIKVDPAAGLFIFSTEQDDTTIVFTRQEPKLKWFNYDAL
jgi:hypothetical protein